MDFTQCNLHLFPPLCRRELPAAVEIFIALSDRWVKWQEDKALHGDQAAPGLEAEWLDWVDKASTMIVNLNDETSEYTQAIESILKKRHEAGGSWPYWDFPWKNVKELRQALAKDAVKPEGWRKRRIKASQLFMCKSGELGDTSDFHTCVPDHAGGVCECASQMARIVDPGYVPTVKWAPCVIIRALYNVKPHVALVRRGNKYASLPGRLKQPFVDLVKKDAKLVRDGDEEWVKQFSRGTSKVRARGVHGDGIAGELAINRPPQSIFYTQAKYLADESDSLENSLRIQRQEELYRKRRAVSPTPFVV